MWQIVARIVVGILLIIHGFAHYQITNGWGSKTTVSSWLLPTFDQAALGSLGTTLWVAALLTFVASGIILFVGTEWWRLVAIAGCVLSLLVIGVFWQPVMMYGAVVDVGILVALLWVRWPSPQLLGA